VHFIQFVQDLVCREVFASSVCFIASSQSTCNKGLLRPPMIDADPQGLRDKAGQGFPSLQDTFSCVQEFGIDPKRGDGGRFHLGFLALLAQCDTGNSDGQGKGVR